MGTVNDLLDVARHQIGVKESPPNSNKVRYNDWFYGRSVSGKAYPWCMAFCQWCYHQVSVRLPAKTASCSALMNAAKAGGRWITKDFKPGDLIIFSFNQNGTPSHCGIYLEKISDNAFYSIEGNTSVGNDSNGGEVMKRKRYLTNVVGAFRPEFTEEVDDVDISKLTNEQCYQMLMKALVHADSLPQPDWSKDAGFFDKALSDKIIGSNTPRGLVRRDELMLILGRLNVL